MPFPNEIKTEKITVVCPHCDEEFTQEIEVKVYLDDDGAIKDIEVELN